MVAQLVNNELQNARREEVVLKFKHYAGISAGGTVENS
jgi:hypothetical protein